MFTNEIGLKIAEIHDLFDYEKFPIVKQKNQKTHRKAYGKKFYGNPNDAIIELRCAGMRLSIEDGGLGEQGHFKQALGLMFPHMKNDWHHWYDRLLECCTGYNQTNTILGGGNIGKSFFLGVFSTLWQAANHTSRKVMILNTTQKTQEERAWGYVADMYRWFPWLPGVQAGGLEDPRINIYQHIIDPTTGNSKKTRLPKAGIITKTIKAGSDAKATADTKGSHPKEYLVICEEANHSRREAMKRIRSNIITNEMYCIILVGNPEIEDVADRKSSDDPLYFFSTPLHGYGSITWGEDFIWETKHSGKCYQFDCYDSPRVLYPGEFDDCTWLPDRYKIAQKARELKGENTPLFKQQMRGFYDHDSLPYQAMSPSMILKFKATDQAYFTGQGLQNWAAFDPAFSGNDEAFLKIAQSGLCKDSVFRIDFLGEHSNFSFRPDASNPEPQSFQMLEWVKKLLEEYKVPFENFTMDTNIIGISLGDIFYKYLSRDINNVKANGPATDTKINGRMAKEFCKNIQAERMVRLQNLITSNKVRGLDPSVLTQLYEWPTKEVGGRTELMPKKEFRKNYGYSPDRAECCLWIADLIIKKGALSNPKGNSQLRDFKRPEEFEQARQRSSVFLDATGYDGARSSFSGHTYGSPTPLMGHVRQEWGQKEQWGETKSQAEKSPFDLHPLIKETLEKM